MKSTIRATGLALAALLSGGCILASVDKDALESQRFHLVPGSGSGPAAVFKVDAVTGRIWFAYWDQKEEKYVWKRLESKDEIPEPKEANF